MKWTTSVLIFSSFLAVCFSNSTTYDEIYARLLPELNSANKLWTAGFNAHFAGQTEKQMKAHCGTIEGRVEGFPIVNHRLAASAGVDRIELPETFDARQKWPQCKSISHIRDQSTCGSCWALATAEVATDRICIKNIGKKGSLQNPVLTAEDALSCCGSYCGFGCNGGYPIRALNWWISYGIVTGGDYGSMEGCQPYSIKPCSSQCPESVTPQCKQQCRAGYSVSYFGDKHNGGTRSTDEAYYLEGDEENVRLEIFKNGPVVAAYTVYQDFYSYRGGVYHHVTGAVSGGHAVKIIGWGTENGVPYWLVANSWGPDWGPYKGFFKIRRGNNECGFEDGICAATTNSASTSTMKLTYICFVLLAYIAFTTRQ